MSTCGRLTRVTLSTVAAPSTVSAVRRERSALVVVGLADLGGDAGGGVVGRAVGEGAVPVLGPFGSERLARLADVLFDGEGEGDGKGQEKDQPRLVEEDRAGWWA